MIPLIRIYIYSVYDNHGIFMEQIKSTGYIIFNRKLKYMGCNEYATTLFPELKEWELEKNFIKPILSGVIGFPYTTSAIYNIV